MFAFPLKIIAAKWALLYCKHYTKYFICIFLFSQSFLFAHVCNIKQPLSPTSLPSCQLLALSNKTNLFPPTQNINFLCDPLRLTSTLCIPKVWCCLLQCRGLSSGSLFHTPYLIFMIFFLRRCVTNLAGFKLTTVPRLLRRGVASPTALLCPSQPLNDPIY